MKRTFELLKNLEWRDTANPRKEMTRKSSNIFVNLCLPECDVGFGIGLSSRLTMRYMAYEFCQEQHLAAAQ
jgi:hypothetical protein